MFLLDRIVKLLKGTKEIGKKFRFKSVCYGHAGDGNLHINIIKDEMSDFNWNNILHKGIREIFELTKSLEVQSLVNMELDTFRKSI